MSIKMSCWTCFSILPIWRVTWVLDRSWNKFRMTVRRIRFIFIITFWITLITSSNFWGKGLLPTCNNDFRLRGKFWINYTKCNLLSFNYIWTNLVENELQKDFEPNFAKITKLSKFRNNYSTNVIYWM